MKQMRMQTVGPLALAAIGLAALAGCTSVPKPPTAVELLTAAKTCKAELPRFGYFDWMYYPPKGTMAVGNDGGWCWVDATFTQFGTLSLYDRSIPVPAKLTLTTAPHGGEVMLGYAGDGVRIAYRPNPGFSGPDEFHVYADEVYHQFDIPMRVTVSP